MELIAQLEQVSAASVTAVLIVAAAGLLMGMKAGIFELRAGLRYWIQVSASPEPTLDLFVVGPLN